MKDQFYVWTIKKRRQVFVTDRAHIPVGGDLKGTFNTWELALCKGQQLERKLKYSLSMDNEAGRDVQEYYDMQYGHNDIDFLTNT